MLRSFGIWCLFFLLLTGAIYWGADSFFVPEVHIELAMKSMHDAHLEIWSSKPAHPPEQENRRIIPLHASQFFTQKSVRFSWNQPDHRLVILPDSKSGSLFIQSIHVEVNAGFIRKVIHDWKGESIKNMLRDSTVVHSANPEFVLLNEHTGMLEWNEAFYQELQAQIPTRHTLIILRSVLSILLSVFLISILNNVFQAKVTWERRPRLAWPDFSSLAFLGILTLFFLNSLFTWIPDKVAHENRKLTDLSALKGKPIVAYPEIISEYTNDHFAFRNILFTAHSVLKSKLFQASSLPEQVIVGKKGWFFKNDTFAVLDARKMNRFDTLYLEGMRTNLLQRIQWLRQRGIKYYVTVPPNHDRIYKEYFPERYQVVPHAGHDRLDYYKMYCQKTLNFSIIDPTDSLMKYKFLHDVYYSTDTHWNLFGAWVGYRNLIEAIRKDFPCIQPIEYHELAITDTFTNQGDLSAMLGMENIYKRKEYRVQDRLGRVKISLPPTAEMVMRFQNSDRLDTCQLKVMVFRDSYSNYLIPYLNLHFKEAVYVWSYNFLQELVLAEKPDIVILEAQQRAMYYAFHTPNLIR